MNHIQSELHDAKVKAAAAMPQVIDGEDIRPPKYEIRMRPSGYWAVFRNNRYVVTTKTMDEALADEFLELYRLQNEAKNKKIVEPRNFDAAEILDYAIRTYPKKKRSRQVVVSVLNAVRPYVAGRRLQDLNGDWLLETEEKMLEKYKYGYFHECIGRLITAIKRYCLSRVCQPIVPFQRPPKAPGRERVLTGAEIDKILRWTNGMEAYDKVTDTWTQQPKISKYDANWREMIRREFALGLAVGSRPGIYDGLSWEPNALAGHIDLGNATFHRLPSGGSAVGRKGAPAVALPPKLLAELTRWKEADDDEAFIFRTTRGTALPQQTARERFAAAMAYLGIEGAVRHTLRHTAITRMIEAGLSATVVSAIAGVSIDVLKKKYDHSDARVVQTIGHSVMDDLLPVAA
jgi:integrase